MTEKELAIYLPRPDWECRKFGEDIVVLNQAYPDTPGDGTEWYTWRTGYVIHVYKLATSMSDAMTMFYYNVAMDDNNVERLSKNTAIGKIDEPTMALVMDVRNMYDIWAGMRPSKQLAYIRRAHPALYSTLGVPSDAAIDDGDLDDIGSIKSFI